MLKKIAAILFLSIIVISVSKAQEYEVYNFKEFQKFLEKSDDKVHVVNFWATWCKPCVEEMPAFNSLYDKYKSKDVEILLVSLDFGKNLDKRINTFKAKHGVKVKIIILDDPDSNSWISKVDKGWSGALPATVIYKNEESNFYERSFTFEELEKEVLKLL